MRTGLVVTNRRCNQNCGFCTERRGEDDRAFISASAVESRIADAIRSGASEVVLTGGEPTLRRDLPALVRAASSRGASVTLETNGAALDAPRVEELRAAGVDLFRLHVPAWGAELNAITRDPEASVSLTAALAALTGAGAPLQIATPIVRSNLGHVAGIPAALVAAVGDARLIRGLRASVPSQTATREELVSFEEAVSALSALDLAARGVGIAVKLAAGSGPPPCVFPKAARPAHLWSLTGRAAEREDRVRPTECAGCQVREQCSGLESSRVARFGMPAIDPIRDERVRRRLALIATVEDQIAREFVTFDRARDPSRGLIDEEIIRVNFHCNQTCTFCFVSTHLPPPGHDSVIAAIAGALSRGAKVVLSGGEPTLNPRLAEYVRLGSRSGALPLQLQTNAVRLEDASLVRSLVDAGLREAFVSLHGGDAATSDAITGAPGTFAKTLVGLDNLEQAGVAVITNFVISADNAAAFPAYVELVATRWPKSTINVSFVAPSTDVVPRDLVPRYSTVLPHLADGLRRARAASVAVRGFESMCGIPLCLVPPGFEELVSLGDLPENSDRGEFTRAEACQQCSAQSRCFGVRRGYVEAHGTDELRPI